VPGTTKTPPSTAWTDAFELIAEEANQRMDDATSPSQAAARYSDGKEALHSAIERARALGDVRRVERLAARLGEIKAIFRSQLS
jgi:hypothetical protein